MLEEEFEIFKEIIKYIPNLPPSYYYYNNNNSNKKLSLKQELFMYYNNNNNNSSSSSMMKCFKCKAITNDLLLYQTPSISRASDELIKINHYCTKCIKDGGKIII